MPHKYIPFTQQPYCCVAACLQMVMYRHGIPLVSQDDLAYELGLTVPEKNAHLFEKVHTGRKPESGWGTQIQNPLYNPNKVFQELGIPLLFDQLFIRDFKTVDGLAEILNNVQGQGYDALLCFDYGKLWDTSYQGGHVCVFDRLDGTTVYMIDPERNVPKYRSVDITKLFAAMNFHGDHNSTGVWRLMKT